LIVDTRFASAVTFDAENRQREHPIHPPGSKAPTMADIPYTDESARAILEYFARHHLRGGDKTPGRALEQQFFENPKFRRDDFEAGLSYAIEKQWLRQEGECFVLTESGFGELPTR